MLPGRGITIRAVAFVQEDNTIIITQHHSIISSQHLLPLDSFFSNHFHLIPRHRHNISNVLVLALSAVPLTTAAFCDLIIEEVRDICAGGPGQAATSDWSGSYKLLKNGVDVVHQESKDFSNPKDQTFTPAGTTYSVHTVYNSLSSSFSTCAYNHGSGWVDGQTSTSTESNYCSRSIATCKLLTVRCDY